MDNALQLQFLSTLSTAICHDACGLESCQRLPETTSRRELQAAAAAVVDQFQVCGFTSCACFVGFLLGWSGLAIHLFFGVSLFDCHTHLSAMGSTGFSSFPREAVQQGLCTLECGLQSVKTAALGGRSKLSRPMAGSGGCIGKRAMPMDVHVLSLDLLVEQECLSFLGQGMGAGQGCIHRTAWSCSRCRIGAIGHELVWNCGLRWNMVTQQQHRMALGWTLE